MTTRLTALEADKAKAEAKLAELAAPPIVQLHPNLPNLYRRKVEQLQVALSEPETRVAAGEIIRSLIARIVLTPVGETLEIKLYGDLAEIVTVSQGTGRQQNGPVSGEAGPLLSVVAGTRNHLYRTTVLVPFLRQEGFKPPLGRQ